MMTKKWADYSDDDDDLPHMSIFLVRLKQSLASICVSKVTHQKLLSIVNEHDVDEITKEQYVKDFVLSLSKCDDSKVLNNLISKLTKKVGE